MEEQRKMQEIRQSISKKDFASFQKWYNLLCRPIDRHRYSKIVEYTVREGFVDGVQMLVKENGVGCLDLFHSRSGNGFHVACTYEQIEIVKFLLSVKDCDKVVTAINSKKQDGLSIAIKKESKKLCEILLSNGIFHIDKNPCSSSSRLFEALSNQKKEMAHFLITHGADVTLVGHNESLGTISCVCLSALRVSSLLGEILKRGGNPNDEHKQTGKSVLQLALEAKADRNTVKAIIRAGANLNRKDKFGKPPVFGLTSLDQLYGFIDAGVEVEDIEQSYKFSILNFVLKSRHESKDVKNFLERGANINFYEDENDGDDSVLIRAISSYYAIEEDVRLLVEHGADPHQTDKAGLTTLQLIFQNRKILYENVLYLLELGVNADGCLLNVIEIYPNTEKEIHLVKRLLECGADPNEESKKNKSVLSAAISRNLTEITEELIKHGADINFIDSKGVSPLGYAFQLYTDDKRLRFLQILLKCPVKILDSYLIDLVNKMANRSTRISTTTRISATTPKHFLFNATEIFVLLIAGADVIIPPSVSYYAIVPEEKKKNLFSVLNKIEREPKSLQHLCRSKIRRELAVRGHSILPLIEDLPIPNKLKSFMKFEDIHKPLEEEIVADYVSNRYGRMYDDDDDRFDYYDYDDYDDKVDSDYEEQFFNVETDEFEPIWW